MGENALLTPKTSQNTRATFDPVSQANHYVESYNSCLMTRIMKKILHTMKMKLKEHVGITISLLYKQNAKRNSNIQNVK